jgi:hypothetical protein
MGQHQPAIPKIDAKVGAPLSARDAQACIAATPIIGEVLAQFHSELGKAKLVIHEGEKAFEDAMEAMVWTDGKDPKQAEADLKAARATAAGDDGFTDPFRGIAHVKTTSAPSTSIHELLHVLTPASNGGHIGIRFAEGLTDYFTKIVCAHNGVPFAAGYPFEIAVVERLVEDVTIRDCALTLFVPGHRDLLATILDSKGPGTWTSFQAAIDAQDGLGILATLDGVRSANADRVVRDQARSAAETAADRAAAPPRSQWPAEGTSATGTVKNSIANADPPCIAVDVGGRDGLRKGWEATVTLRDGTVIVSTVTEVKYDESIVRMPSAEASAQAQGVVQFRRAP